MNRRPVGGEFSPRLGENERERAARIVFQNVEGGRIAAGRLGPVFEGRQPVQDVLNDKLNADVLQIVVCRVVSSIVTERKVERVLRRLDVRVIADSAREG